MGWKAAIEIEGKSKASLELADGKSGAVHFTLRALRAYGAAKLRVIAKAGDIEVEESLEVPFAPAQARTREVKRIELDADRTDLRAHLQGWVPTTEKSTIWVTSNPYGDVFDHLKYLVHYPYGCIEQTTSSARPLLYVGRLIGNIDPQLLGGRTLDAMITAGINRIFSMQTASGGFGYWPGAQEPSGWGSAYAMHFLIDAKKLRYPVPEERLNDALEWMERELSHRYDDANKRNSDWYQWEGAEAYMHFVLALSGKARRARIERLIEDLRKRKDSESYEQMYMLQAALYLSGDHRYEAELRKPDVSELKNERKNSWSFYSDRRRRGFVLATFHDLFGAAPEGEKLAELVAEGLRGHPSHWYTTQELVWAVTGLGKRIGDTQASFGTPVLTANNKRVNAEGVDEKAHEKTWAIARASEYGTLTLDVPDRKGRVYLVISSEGVREGKTMPIGGEGLSLTREYRAVNGEPISLSGGLKLGDVVYVVLTLNNRTRERMNNIALVDRFPASFEIENPRLGRGSTALSWIDESTLWPLESMDLRDDRIQLFGALEASQAKKFVYALRVVTAGQFAVPTSEAEAMYYPEHWAREAGGRAVVKGLRSE